MINFKHFANKLAEDQYDWCIFVNEPKEVLKEIVIVEYFLHPTFPNPHRIKYNANENFILYSGGWGEFHLKIKIGFGNGLSEYRDYYLDFKHEWPKLIFDETQYDEDYKEIYYLIYNSEFNWRKQSTIINKSTIGLEKTHAILNKLKLNNLIRNAEYLSIDKQELFGVTAKIGIDPIKTN